MTGRALTLRCQAKNGRHVLNGLSTASTIVQLKQKIAELTCLPSASIRVLAGYPPKDIDLSDDSRELLGVVNSGDTLIVEEQKRVSGSIENSHSVPSVPSGDENVARALQDQLMHARGILTRKVVPADNSCLFTSIHGAMNKGDIDSSLAAQYRELIAGLVLSDPHLYTEPFLGRSNKDYCKWIQKDDSWGGAIEISILSSYFKMEIDIVDTQSGRIDRFGEDKNYSKRVFLLYDGIHYDFLVLDMCDPSRPIETIFSTSDALILAQAMEIAAEAKASRQFTDVANFSLKCLICSKGLRGQAEAQEHAQTTGHINFGEI